MTLSMTSRIRIISLRVLKKKKFIHDSVFTFNYVKNFDYFKTFNESSYDL